MATTTTTTSTTTCAPDDPICELPTEAKVIIVCFLVMSSALFSGLTLGLLGLDKIGLDIVIHGDNPAAAKNAMRIKPVRDNGNLLLCTLLLGNVTVNTVLSIFLDSMFNALVGIIFSTTVIVILGEIVPQALCSRYALQVGAAAIPLVKFLIVIFYVIAKPLALVLDCVLGEELGTIHSKVEIMRLLEIHFKHGAVDDEEKKMMQGALTIQNVLLKNIMTPIEDVFMLPLDSKLDFDLLTKIFKSGFSRIPVYNHTRDYIVGLLVTKDLIFIDPEDGAPLQQFLQVFGRRIERLFTDTKATQAFKVFKTGKAHMSLVLQINDTGEGDPFYEVKGVVTIEDIIEEILQDEIVDETDVHIDVHDKTKVLRTSDHGPQMDITRIRLFNPDYLDEERLLPEESAAVAAHLLYNHHGPVDASGVRSWLPKSALSWMLHEKATVRRISRKAGRYQEPRTEDWLCVRGKQCPSMFIVITGQVTAWSGIEAVRSVQGAFTVFGIDALLSSYISDVSFCVNSETLRVVEVTREVYEGCLNLYKEGFDFPVATRKDHLSGSNSPESRRSPIASYPDPPRHQNQVDTLSNKPGESLQPGSEYTFRRSRTPRPPSTYSGIYDV